MALKIFQIDGRVAQIKYLLIKYLLFNCTLQPLIVVSINFAVHGPAHLGITILLPKPSSRLNLRSCLGEWWLNYSEKVCLKVLTITILLELIVRNYNSSTH